jgi:hypothetical protein
MFLAPFVSDLTCGPAGGGDRSAVCYVRGSAAWLGQAAQLRWKSSNGEIMYRRGDCNEHLRRRGHPVWTERRFVLGNPEAALDEELRLPAPGALAGERIE